MDDDLAPIQREDVFPHRSAGPRLARDESAHRWTVDTPEDLDVCTRIIEALDPADPNYPLQAALDLVAQHPEWTRINSHIEQKKIQGEEEAKARALRAAE
jgi:spore coat polysaccharide biosynthesis protein SpsF (cytidylyltransferase family)